MEGLGNRVCSLVVCLHVRGAMSYRLVREQKQHPEHRSEWEPYVRAMACQLGWELSLEHTGIGTCLMLQCLIDMKNMLQDISENKRLSWNACSNSINFMAT